MDPIEIVKNDRKKGDDGCKVFSIRIPESMAAELEAAAKDANLSRNELIRRFLSFCVANFVIVEKTSADDVHEMEKGGRS